MEEVLTWQHVRTVNVTLLDEIAITVVELVKVGTLAQDLGFANFSKILFEAEVGDNVGIGPESQYCRAWYQYPYRFWEISSNIISIGIDIYITFS